VVPLLPGFARRRLALKDQQKMAPVYHTRWESTLGLKDHWKMASVSYARCESTLPLTLSLSDSGNYFYPLARRRRGPNTISFYDFLFSCRAGDQWPSSDRAAELGGRWQQHPA
jgi:hypothetical protein